MTEPKSKGIDSWIPSLGDPELGALYGLNRVTLEPLRPCGEYGSPERAAWDDGYDAAMAGKPRKNPHK